MDLKFDISHGILVVLYFGLFIFSLIKLLIQKKSVIRVLFHFFLLLGCAFRVTSFTLFILLNEDVISVDGSFLYLTASLPSFFFLTFYSAALVLSVDLFQISTKIKPVNIKTLSLIVLLANICLYVMVIILFVLDFEVFPDEVASLNAPTSVFQKTIQFIIVGIYLIASVSFFLFLYIVYYKNYETYFRDANVNVEYNQLKQKSNGVIFFSFVCFFLRSFFTCLTIFYPGASLWWKDLAYYMGLEFLPLFLLLFIYLKVAVTTPGLHTFHPYSQLHDENSKLTANSGYIARVYGGV
ncbi:hypothetical protein CYY_006037 [Polysphondylium violaceum]|uniref:THH1/TOM1/TOM3 domain-containing protein n=1 Tax=Polysphondylium violaceum TaxID=133409 RepID=A0A8J4PTA8_9MYCE|nr:hypothetical protein CYY_006037 [Polysphondylium violaceum]